MNRRMFFGTLCAPLVAARAVVLPRRETVFRVWDLACSPKGQSIVATIIDDSCFDLVDPEVARCLATPPATISYGVTHA